MSYRIPSLIVLTGGVLMLSAATANADPFTSVIPGSNRNSVALYPLNNGMVIIAAKQRTWSPYPLNTGGMVGGDPGTWSPYPISNRSLTSAAPLVFTPTNKSVMPGSDTRTWSPYPLYPHRYVDNGPIPYWLQNPNWRASNPGTNVLPYYYNPYAGSISPFVNPYGASLLNPYANLPLNGLVD
jgi:hypothetical protein